MPKEDTQFKPGHSGGPGRHKGSKNKLSETFLQALANDFEEYGPEAIVQVREKTPGEYLRVIAGLMPKELMLEVSRDEPVKWVINAAPRELTEEEWRAKHGLENGAPVKNKAPHNYAKAITIDQE